MSHGGRGVRKVQKSVTYYLNGPLHPTEKLFKLPFFSKFTGTLVWVDDGGTSGCFGDGVAGGSDFTSSLMMFELWQHTWILLDQPFTHEDSF